MPEDLILYILLLGPLITTVALMIIDAFREYND